MYKLYCRIYQSIFKVGMNFLPWRIPKTLEGPGSVKELPALIRKKHFKKVLIVTDKVLRELGLLISKFDFWEHTYEYFDD